MPAEIVCSVETNQTAAREHTQKGPARYKPMNIVSMAVKVVLAEVCFTAHCILLVH